MLIVHFRILVDDDRADEIQSTLTDGYGVAITNAFLTDEKLCWNEPESRMVFECFAPYKRIESLMKYLDDEFAGTAILAF